MDGVRRSVMRGEPAGGNAAPAHDDSLSVVDLDLEPEPRSTTAAARRAKLALAVTDAAAIGLGWLLGLNYRILPLDHANYSFGKASLMSLALVAVGLALLASKRLYSDWVRSVGSVELARLTQVAVLLGVVSLAVLGVGGRPAELGNAMGGAGLTLVFLLVGRAGHRSWLAAARRQGLHTTPVVIVGANDEGFNLYTLLECSPGLGYRPCGVVGDPGEWRRHGFDVPWLGPVSDTVRAVRASGATQALVATGSMSFQDVNRVVRSLLEAGVPVQISGGLRGFDHRRLKLRPLAREPLFYLEPTSLSRWQVAAKRVIDMAVASVLLVGLAPVLAVAALGIKLYDRGPVLFRQVRIGRNGRPFTLWKLRTMVPDAEARVAAVRAHNVRTDGPLFKMVRDPRVTPVGRFLRATSIDEMPQLVQVLRGEMSLVGPRPALPAEFDEFSEGLRERSRVPPGITGLWQIEARDDPSFLTYQRLDLFYLENWSVSLDLAVMLATLRVILARAVVLLRSGNEV